MPPDTPNERVTLAEIQRDIIHLTNIVELYHEADTNWRLDHEARLRVLEKHGGEMSNRIGRIEQRQGIIAGLQGAYTTILAAIAGWFGSRS